VTRINLLDWRAERREQRRRQFFAMLGIAFMVCASVIVVWRMTMASAIDTQTERNQFLKTQIAEADRKIKEIQELEKVRANLVGRMQVIEELQASRTASVHFFDELVNTLPEGVSLKSVKQAGTKVVIEGIAESNGRVSAYMKNLQASAWFENPRLIVIRSAVANRRRQSQFQLEVQKLNKAQASQPADSSVSGELE
jgi:type IV pilus assembly protein PilN